MTTHPEFPDRAALDRQQRARLQSLLVEILPRNGFYARKFAGRDPARLDQLPFTTKAELVADQADHPPYGTNLSYPLEQYTRLHQTSGTSTGRPLRWLDTPQSSQAMLVSWRQILEMIRATSAARF